MRKEKAAHEHLLAKDKKFKARVTAILDSNWKSANAVAGDNLEELDSNVGDELSQDEVNGDSSRSDSRLGKVTVLRKMTIKRCDNRLGKEKD